MKISPEELEKIARKHKDRLRGGKADNKKLTSFPLSKLLKGMRHEMEHPSDPDLAAEIASDHLVSNINYYDRDLLKEIEECLNKSPIIF